MLNPRRLRRNDVVTERDTSGGFFPGRVWRRIDDTHVEVVNVGAHVRVYHEDELKLVDYKGMWKWMRAPGNDRGLTPVWIPMTTLRQLKIQCSQYNAHFGGCNGWGRRWTRQERAEALANPHRYVPRADARWRLGDPVETA